MTSLECLMLRALMGLLYLYILCSGGMHMDQTFGILTTAGDGTWMLGTALGLTWLAMWHRMTPSTRATDRSSGNEIRSRVSICWNWKNKVRLMLSNNFI